MNYKSLVKIMFVIVLSLVLAACGGNNNVNNSGNAAAPKENKQEPSENKETPEEKVTLTITSWSATEIQHEVYKKIQEEINKIHPEIVIDFQPVKATEYNTALNTALQTGTAADIIHLRPYAGAQVLADADYLEPIDGLNGLDVFTADQLIAAQGTDGTQYGVPHMLSSTQMLYNKRIFEEHGLEIPQTWDEFIAIADTLKAKNVTPLAFGSKDGWVLSLMHGAVGPQFFGLDFLDKLKSGETSFDSPEFLSSIEAMNNLRPYFPNNFEGLAMEDIRTLFAAEQAAMVINGHFEIVNILGLNENLDMGVFPIPPVDPNGKASIATWVDGSFGINKNSEKKEAARKYLEFMTTQAYGSIILNELKAPTPIPGVKTDDPIINEIARLSSTNATPYMAVTYLNSGEPTTKTVLQDALQGMYLDKLTPEEVVQQVQESYNTWK
jgi:raffinose/stachyose/melibiose transport system substrate-binding protein